jgi:hypothetical protein
MLGWHLLVLTMRLWMRRVVEVTTARYALALALEVVW